MEALLKNNNSCICFLIVIIWLIIAMVSLIKGIIKNENIKKSLVVLNKRFWLTYCFFSVVIISVLFSFDLYNEQKPMSHITKENEHTLVVNFEEMEGKQGAAFNTNHENVWKEYNNLLLKKYQLVDAGLIYENMKWNDSNEQYTPFFHYEYFQTRFSIFSKILRQELVKKGKELYGEHCSVDILMDTSTEYMIVMKETEQVKHFVIQKKNEIFNIDYIGDADVENYLLEQLLSKKDIKT